MKARSRLVIAVVVIGIVGAACDSSTERRTTAKAPAREHSSAAPRPFPTTWTARAAGYPTAFAVDDRGTVSVGEEGGVVALDAGGQMQWATLVDGWPARRTPALVDDLVVVPTADRLVALDRATGAVRWQQPASESRVAATASGEPSAIVAADSVGSITAFDAGGAPRWSFVAPAPVPDSTPYVWIADDVVLTAWGASGKCCTLLAADVATGATRWSERIAPTSTAPLVHDGSVIVAENPTPGESAARGRAIDLSTGRTVWSVPLRGRYSPGLHAGAAGNDIVFVDEAGAFTMVDLVTASVRWRSEPVYPQETATPVVAGDRVFLIAFDTVFVGLDRRSGDLLGKGPIEPPVFVAQMSSLGDRVQMLVASNGLGAVWNLEQAPRR